jgi:hypothetical protein
MYIKLQQRKYYNKPEYWNPMKGIPKIEVGKEEEGKWSLRFAAALKFPSCRREGNLAKSSLISY